MGALFNARRLKARKGWGPACTEGKKFCRQSSLVELQDTFCTRSVARGEDCHDR